jgi:hypothetical protein
MSRFCAKLKKKTLIYHIQKKKHVLEKALYTLCCPHDPRNDDITSNKHIREFLVNYLIEK